MPLKRITHFSLQPNRLWAPHEHAPYTQQKLHTPTLQSPYLFPPTDFVMAKDFSIKFSSAIGKLKEGDWLRWSREISMALRAQRGWGYVDGTTTAPDPLELSEWNAAHDQIVGALGTWSKCRYNANSSQSTMPR